MKKIKEILAVILLAMLFTASFNVCACFAAGKKGDFSLETKRALDFGAIFKLKLPVIADYGSEGCGPCRRMYPALKSANEKYRGKAVIKFADVWKYRDAAGDMPLQVIPTQFFFTADGKPFVPSDKLDKKFKFMRFHDKNGKHTLTAHQGGLTESDFDEILKEMGVK